MTLSSGYQIFETPNGKKLPYYLSLPRNFNEAKTYRVILAIPPGDQTKEFVGVYSGWFDYFRELGWVVISPVTPNDKLFFQGPERYLPRLLKSLDGKIKVFGNKFYLLGVSNGGISAFRASTLYPEKFHSITVLPGWPKPADENRLDKIIGIPINFVVGEIDERWRKKSEEFYETLKNLGADVSYEIIPGEGHMGFHRYPLDKLVNLLTRSCG